jgi:hypothetical protein
MQKVRIVIDGESRIPRRPFPVANGRFRGQTGDWAESLPFCQTGHPVFSETPFCRRIS